MSIRDYLPAQWPPRDWRMLYALGLLAVAGAGAWVMAFLSLKALVPLADKTGDVWAIAYFAYGALGLLAIPSVGFAMLVSLKSFRVALPGDTGFSAEGDRDPPATTTLNAAADALHDKAEEIKEEANG